MAFRDVTNTIQHVQSYAAFAGEKKPRHHRGSDELTFGSALESLERGLETNDNAFKVLTDCEPSIQVVSSWKVPATFVDLSWIHAKFQKHDLDAVRVSVDDAVSAKFPCGKVSAEHGVRNNARGEVTKMHRDGTLEVKWADARLTNVPREWVRFASRSRLTTRGAFAVLERLRAMSSPVEFLIEEFLPDGVYEYTADIFQCMRREQERRPLNPDFMRTQPDINSRMRAILNDWLFALHLSLRFRMETLFLAVACTDRYLSRNVVRRQNFQLVGVTAMLIAAKVEETGGGWARDGWCLSEFRRVENGMRYAGLRVR